MKQTAVEWLVQELQICATKEEMDIIEQAKEIEKEQKGYSKEEVDKLLDTLLENNMCSVVGDELIQTFK